MFICCRWNSVYDMLERFIEQRAAVVAALVELECHDLVTHFSHFGELEAIKLFLHPMKIITTALSSEALPTGGMVLPTVAKLTKICENKEDDCATLKAMKTAMRGDLENRYTDESDIDFLRICQIFDPRFRSLKDLSEYAQSKVYSNTQELVVKMSSREQDCGVELDELNVDIEVTAFDTNNVALDVQSTGDKESEDNNAAGSSRRKSAMELFFDDDTTQISNSCGDDQTLQTSIPEPEMVAKEISNYRFEAQISKTQNPLHWWKEHEFKYPLLAKTARRFLTVQATSVASERVFSTAGSIVTAKRSLISSEHVDELLFLTKNMDQV